MIFYVAQGAADACGPGCSDWIAAEGTVQFDTNRRLIAILERQAGRKLPLVIHAWGRSNLSTATRMGRILRDRGIDATAGATDVEACHDKAEAECFALKRPGGPLDATIKTSDTARDIACVLMLAGAMHRSLPPTTRVILTGMTIFNRLAPNVSEEEREGATAILGQQFRLYLQGVDAMPVKNPNVKSIRTTIEIDKDGVETVVVVETDLELNAADPAFDVAKVDALIDAAMKSFGTSGGTIDRIHLVPVQRK